MNLIGCRFLASGFLNRLFPCGGLVARRGVLEVDTLALGRFVQLLAHS